MIKPSPELSNHISRELGTFFIIPMQVQEDATLEGTGRTAKSDTLRPLATRSITDSVVAAISAIWAIRDGESVPDRLVNAWTQAISSSTAPQQSVSLGSEGESSTAETVSTSGEVDAAAELMIYQGRLFGDGKISEDSWLDQSRDFIDTFGAEGLVALVRLLWPRNLEAAASTLLYHLGSGRLGWHPSLDAWFLESALIHPSPGIRDAAVVGFLNLGQSAHAPALTRALARETIPSLKEEMARAINYLSE